MQVKVKHETQVVKPVTLEITFETAEEAGMLSEMLMWNVTIPYLVYPDEEDENQKLSLMMSLIRNSVLKVKQGV
jgi:hypothetical protein